GTKYRLPCWNVATRWHITDVEAACVQCLGGKWAWGRCSSGRNRSDIWPPNTLRTDDPGKHRSWANENSFSHRNDGHGRHLGGVHEHRADHDGREQSIQRG